MEFADLPDTHDGATAFAFRLDFSEDVDIEPEDMRDHALTVVGATVTSAARVDGQSDLWEITLTPDGEADVGIVLPVGRACTEEGALCTAAGINLSGTVPVPLIPYAAPTTDEAPGTDGSPGLTASFENVPASHDGSSTFTLELAFSEAPEVGYLALRDEALSASGGTVRRARRTVQGQNDRWEIHVEPSGDGAVTVSLPATTGGCSDAGAICTADGTALSEGATATIEGPEPPELSIADAEVEEGPNAKLVFAITLSRAASQSVTFDIATSDGSAVAGEDYVAKSKTKTFPAGMTEGRFGIRVLDDDHNEDSETMTVTISNVTGATLADGTATGTITNSDLMPQAWLARFGRTVADQVIDAVEGRMAAARAPGTEVSLAGRRVGAAGAEETDLDSREAEAGLETLADWLRGAGGEEEASGLTSRTVSGRELLSGSSFALTAGSAESGFGALWGRGAVSSFDGREGEVTLDGEVASALLGADFSLGRGTAGLVVAHSLGEGGYRSPNGGGAVETTLTGLYPWGRYQASERLSCGGSRATARAR